MTDIAAVSTHDFLYGSLLTVAKGARESIARSTHLTAVNASHVEVLANACVGLSSDSGAMASLIISAEVADDLSKSSIQARDLMQVVAGTAEKASLLVMQCSMLAAWRDMADIMDRLIAAGRPTITPALQSELIGASEQARTLAGKSAEVVRSMKSLTVEFAQGAGAVQPLLARLWRMRILSPAISSDLATVSRQLGADTNMTFGLLQVAIESTIAADAAVAESAAYSAWIGELAAGLAAA